MVTTGLTDTGAVDSPAMEVVRGANRSREVLGDPGSGPLWFSLLALARLDAFERSKQLGGSGSRR
jgi:hypothetical protein